MDIALLLIAIFVFAFFCFGLTYMVIDNIPEFMEALDKAKRCLKKRKNRMTFNHYNKDK